MDNFLSFKNGTKFLNQTCSLSDKRGFSLTDKMKTEPTLEVQPLTFSGKDGKDTDNKGSCVHLISISHSEILTLNETDHMGVLS